MCELKVHQFITTDELFPEANAGALYYDKSEADKVIARLKYKRCFAMKKMCQQAQYKYSILSQFESSQISPNPKSYKRYDSKFRFYLRWRKRWLKLAEDCKRANTTTEADLCVCYGLIDNAENLLPKCKKCNALVWNAENLILKRMKEK